MSSHYTRGVGLAFALTLLAAGILPVQAGDSVTMYGPSRFAEQDGAALFHSLCQGCHMQDAQGATGAAAYPALAHNPKLRSAAYPVYMVLHGRKAMPPLRYFLSDAQVAAVVTYVRTHFGNNYTDPIGTSMVKAARESP